VFNSELFSYGKGFVASWDKLRCFLKIEDVDYAFLKFTFLVFLKIHW